MGVWIETKYCRIFAMSNKVTPYVGVWIETGNIYVPPVSMRVTPYVGVWIETRLRPLFPQVP